MTHIQLIHSLREDFLMPPLLILLSNGILLRDVFFVLTPGHSGASYYNTLEQAKADGANTWNLGLFLENAIDFIFSCLLIFWFIRFVQRILASLKEGARLDSRQVCLDGSC